jgi:hypothetical protein
VERRQSLNHYEKYKLLDLGRKDCAPIVIKTIGREEEADGKKSQIFEVFINDGLLFRVIGNDDEQSRIFFGRKGEEIYKSFTRMTTNNEQSSKEQPKIHMKIHSDGQVLDEKSEMEAIILHGKVLEGTAHLVEKLLKKVNLDCIPYLVRLFVDVPALVNDGLQRELDSNVNRNKIRHSGRMLFWEYWEAIDAILEKMEIFRFYPDIFRSYIKENVPKRDTVGVDNLVELQKRVYELKDEIARESKEMLIKTFEDVHEQVYQERVPIDLLLSSNIRIEAEVREFMKERAREAKAMPED